MSRSTRPSLTPPASGRTTQCFTGSGRGRLDADRLLHDANPSGRSTKTRSVAIAKRRDGDHTEGARLESEVHEVHRDERRLAERERAQQARPIVNFESGR